jgi:hypothetical protein
VALSFRSSPLQRRVRGTTLFAVVCRSYPDDPGLESMLRPSVVAADLLRVRKSCGFNHVAVIIALTFSGEKNAAGEIVPALTCAKPSMAF